MSITLGNIAQAALWVTMREGSKYVEDPYPSRFGISLHYHPELTEADVRAMTQQRAAQIMTAQYWPKGAEALPSCLAVPLLSFAVLDGPVSAVQRLQEALAVHVDGEIGAQTIHAAQLPAANDLLEVYFGACMARLHSSPRWLTDGLGWERRQMRASLEAQRSVP